MYNYTIYIYILCTIPSLGVTCNGNKSASKHLKSRDAQIVDGRPPRQLNFLSWWLIFVVALKRCCSMSPSQQLQFWKIGGLKLSAKILSCQGNYIYCVITNAGAFYSEYKLSLSIQKFSSRSSYSKNLLFA